MRLQFEIRDKSGQHLGVLPIHLHVVDLAIDPDRAQKGIQGDAFKQEGIATDTR